MRWERIDWGVRFDSGYIHLCKDEVDAETIALQAGGEMVSRAVWVTK